MDATPHIDAWAARGWLDTERTATPEEVSSLIAEAIALLTTQGGIPPIPAQIQDYLLVCKRVRVSIGTLAVSLAAMERKV